MFRAAADRLHRRPHVLIGRQEIPTRGQKLLSRYPPAVVLARGTARKAIGDRQRPDEIAVPAYHGVRGAVLVRLIGKERRVYAAVDNPRALLARHAADFVAAPRVPGVDADAHDVAFGDRGHVDVLERLIDEMRIAPVVPVAAANTYSHRGVMTATPNDT